MGGVFNLYTNNSLTRLAEQYTAGRRVNLQQFRGAGGLFSRENVTVPTKGMGVWLEHFLVDNGDVSANMDFTFVRKTVDRILRNSIAEIEKESGKKYRPELFTQEVLTWRIHGILKNKDDALSILSDYVEGRGCPELRRYQLAAKLGGLFFQYISMIPDVLEGDIKEDDAPSKKWQLQLWKQLCKHRGEDVLSPAGAILKFLDRKFQPSAMEPVTFFGVSAMPPFFLRLLQKQSQVSPVNMFYHNPCDEYWADQLTPGELRKKNQESEKLTSVFEQTNSLLGSLGVQGREFFKAVMDLDGCVVEHWDDVINNHWTTGGKTEQHSANLLEDIQNHIISMTNPDREEEPESLKDDDDSLTVHSCFNETRQVEQLHDSLLHIISKSGGSIAMNDIIVMAPDISRFIPAIHSVFSQGPLKNHYCITDRSIKSANMVAESFLAILNIPGSRFQVTRIVSLLESPALRNHFGLDEDSVILVKNWLERAKISWGIDGAERKQKYTLGFSEYSWQQGLDRLLLNLAADSADTDEDKIFYNELIPVPFPSSEDNNRILGELCLLFRQLCDFAKATEQPRSMKDWCELLADTVKNFFTPDKESAKDYGALLNALGELRLNYELSGSGEEQLPFLVVRAALQSYMDCDSSTEPFLNGKITFCSLKPMRSVPAAVIAMLGMEEGEFPRQDERLGFSLMNDANLMKFYNRSRSVEDRYVFLETILAARQHLLIFYTGQNDRNLDIKHPAVPVAELLDYAKTVRSFSEEAIHIRHSLNSFDRANFKDNNIELLTLRNLFSYSGISAEIASCSIEENKELSPFAKGLNLLDFDLGLLPCKLEKDKDGKLCARVELQSLEYFLKDPTTAFLSRYSGIKRPKDDRNELADEEPFKNDYKQSAIQKRKVANILKQYISDGHNEPPQWDEAAKDIYEKLKANCQLPVGNFGLMAFKNEFFEAWIDDAVFRTNWAKTQPKDIEIIVEDVPLLMPDELSKVLDEALGITKEERDKIQVLAPDNLLQLLGITKEDWDKTHNVAEIKVNVLLHGKFEASETGIYLAAYTSKSGKQLILPYLQHLMLCAANEGTDAAYTSTVLWKNGDINIINHADSAAAMGNLRDILTLYMTNRPVPLFENSSPIMPLRSANYKNKFTTEIRDALKKNLMEGSNAAPLYSTGNGAVRENWIIPMLHFADRIYKLLKKTNPPKENTGKAKPAKENTGKTKPAKEKAEKTKSAKEKKGKTK